MAQPDSKPTKIFLEIPKNLIQEPLIHTLGTKFDVVPNIRAGSITETLARIALELSGDPGEIQKAIHYIRELGISIEPIEAD